MMASQEWLGGDNSFWCGGCRPALVFDSSRKLGSQGRVYFLGKGFTGAISGEPDILMIQGTAYGDQYGGWLPKKLDFGVPGVKWAPSAALYKGEIVLAGVLDSASETDDGMVFLWLSRQQSSRSEHG